MSTSPRSTLALSAGRWLGLLAITSGTITASYVLAAEPVASSKSAAKVKALKIEAAIVGTLADGRKVQEFTLTSPSGLSLKVMAYGATLTSVIQPDRDGNLKEVTLGFDKLAQYEDKHPYFGVTVGRYANRIALGKFSLGGKEYKLATNNGPNHLHGGLRGFDKVLWKAEPIEKSDVVGVEFSYTSPDGEEGYPGKLEATSKYTLNANDELTMEWTAKTDKATPVNMTNHAYYNLAGAGSGDILGHELTIHATKYVPVDKTSIPTGELAAVQDTPMDFTTPHKVGERIAQVEGGYDHCYVLNKASSDNEPAPAATVVDPKSGRAIDILATQPGIQFYSGNYLDGVKGRGSDNYLKHHGFCLETQHFPDSPNQAKFPSAILEPGKTYSHRTVQRFYAK